MKNWITPENHFLCKSVSLSGQVDGKILDAFLLYIEPGGGGPKPVSIHEYDHLFTVIEGKVEVFIGDELLHLGEGESVRIPGMVSHSIWNNADSIAKIIGLSLIRKND